MRTIESNKLISLFMADFEQHESDRLDTINQLTNKGAEAPRYDDDWELLMPVVEEIFNTGVSGGVRSGLNRALLTARKESIYKEVVSFIKWYNENK